MLKRLSTFGSVDQENVIDFEIHGSKPEKIFVGSTVSACLVVKLTDSVEVQKIQIQIYGESVTRQVIRGRKSSRVETDRSSIVNVSVSIPFQADSSSFKVLRAGNHQFPFQFYLPRTVGGTLVGPNLEEKGLYWGQMKPKFEVNYWFEPSVVYTTKGLLGKSTQTCKKRLNFLVYESPSMYLIPHWVRSECHVRFEKILTSLFFKSRTGRISITLHLSHVYFKAGDRIKISLQLENKARASFDRVRVALCQCTCYYIHEHEKRKTEAIASAVVCKVIAPNCSESLDGELKIPETATPSTPEICVDRKINVTYEIHVDLVSKGKFREQVEKIVKQPVVISNIQF